MVDRRFLIVEYKGFDRWSDDDSTEKRTVGQVMEEESDGQCLFIMPKVPDWDAIMAKIGQDAQAYFIFNSLLEETNRVLTLINFGFMSDSEVFSAKEYLPYPFKIPCVFIQ